MNKNDIQVLEDRLNAAKSLSTDSDAIESLLSIWKQHNDCGTKITGIKIQLEHYYLNDDYNEVKGLQESFMVSDPKTIELCFNLLQTLKRDVDAQLAEI